jgi:hypothetical protein
MNTITTNLLGRVARLKSDIPGLTKRVGEPGEIVALYQPIHPCTNVSILLRYANGDLAEYDIYKLIVEDAEDASH